MPRESAGGRLPKGDVCPGVSARGVCPGGEGVCPGVSARGVCPGGEGVCQGVWGVCPEGGSTWRVPARECLPRGVSARLPSEQNHRKVQKHYLAATTLRTVKI